MKRISLLIIVVLLFIGCESNPCKDRMNKARRELGEPEITVYISKEYHSETWMWYDKGLSYTWTWGVYVDGCEKSTYKFSGFAYKLIVKEKFDCNCKSILEP